jgi:glycosyltransferase involved in cell wall biosynthesis
MSQIKENNCILICGTPNWQPVLLNIMSKAGLEAKQLSSFKTLEKYIRWLFSRKSQPYRIIYHLGGCATTLCTLEWLRGKHTIVHWIGSDVMQYQGKLNLKKRLSIWVHQHLVALKLADSEKIQEELRKVGIETHLLRLLPQAIVVDVTELPDKPTVLSYWNDERYDFYGGGIVFALAKAFPQLKFLIVGATGEDLVNVPANVKFLGLVDDISKIYNKCTCLVRVPMHDGLSAMVLEAMAHGRYVIYSRKCPFTSFASDYESARKALEEIITKQQPNYEGADYVKKNFSVEKESQRLRELMERTFGNY